MKLTPSLEHQVGAGAKAISESIGIPIEDVQVFIKTEEALYPGVVEMQKAWIEEVNKNSYIDASYRTASGRMARVGKLNSITGRQYTFISQDTPEWLKSASDTTFMPTQIKNYPIQGFAGEIIKSILGRLYRELKKSDFRDKVLLINTVHDSILLDSHPAHELQAARLVKQVMEDTPRALEEKFGFKFNLPIRCEVSIGTNWLETEKVDL